MSEHVTEIPVSVSIHLLRAAIMRLDGRKHPEKVTVIDRTIRERETDARRCASVAGRRAA